jgi:hypothetical protein
VFQPYVAYSSTVPSHFTHALDKLCKNYGFEETCISVTRYPTGKVAPTGPPLYLWGWPVGAGFMVGYLVTEIQRT